MLPGQRLTFTSNVVELVYLPLARYFAESRRTGATLALVALSTTFYSETYRPAVLGVAVFLAAAIVYFLAYSRHRLVAQAPEEEAALVAAAEKELVHR